MAKLTLTEFMKHANLRQYTTKQGGIGYSYEPENADTAHFDTPDGTSSLYVPVDAYDDYCEFLEGLAEAEKLFNQRAKSLRTRLDRAINSKIEDIQKRET